MCKRWVSYQLGNTGWSRLEELNSMIFAGPGMTLVYESSGATSTRWQVACNKKLEDVLVREPSSSCVF